MHPANAAGNSVISLIEPQLLEATAARNNTRGLNSSVRSQTVMSLAVTSRNRRFLFSKHTGSSDTSTGEKKQCSDYTCSYSYTSSMK